MLQQLQTKAFFDCRMRCPGTECRELAWQFEVLQHLAQGFVNGHVAVVTVVNECMHHGHLHPQKTAWAPKASDVHAIQWRSNERKEARIVRGKQCAARDT